jgi:hypothetical protein
MIKLPSVTLISLAAIGIEKTLRALEASMDSIAFFDSKIISPNVPSNLPKGVKWESSGPLRLRGAGIDDYSKYFLYDIWKHVESEYCLVIQGDGYVINPHLWSNEFLEFDYIGAPWQLKRNAYIDPFGNHQQVGNGGFSLRSRKLLTTPQRAEVPFEVTSGSFYKTFDSGSLAEDGNICVHNRHIFEKAGNKFAPLEVAVRFSQERRIPEMRGVEAFGFHEFKPHKNRFLRQLGLRTRV